MCERCIGLVVACLLTASGAAGESFTVAREGRAATAIVVSPDAGDDVRRSAGDLATMLGRITGGDFNVTVRGDESANRRAIHVGLFSDQPEVSVSTDDADLLAQRERYILRSTADRLLVLGATELAVQHAVWDLLSQAGYRRFFPGPAWEVVPHEPNLTLDVDVDAVPAYAARRIWYGSGTWDYNSEPYDEWRTRNRLGGDFALRTGHAYRGIVHEHPEVFAEHPEYLALIDGRRIEARGEMKFCVSNKDLRRFIVAYAVNELRERGGDSVSLDPSDGGGWCACSDCESQFPTISDRVVTLANEAAAAIVEELGPDRYVGIYAYGFHSPPPTIRVHPNVIVSFATGFIREGYTLEELITGWRKQGVELFGIREYLSVHQWDVDLPGRARAGSLEYLARTIPGFADLGARFYTAEASDNWGPNGLGYYVASRLLWKPARAEHVDEIVDEFFTLSFGAAQEPMRAFYRLLDKERRPMLSDDLVGRMFTHLRDARLLAADRDDVMNRLDDLAIYTQYVALYHAYAQVTGSKRQHAYEEMLRHSYQSRRRMMVHVKALFGILQRRDSSVEFPEGVTRNGLDADHPWRELPAYTRDEIDAMIARGIETHPLLTFTPVSFSEELVPPAWETVDVPRGTFGRFLRASHTFNVWFDEPVDTLDMKVTGGLITHYRDRGDATLALHTAGLPIDEQVAEGAAPPNGEVTPIRLRSPHAGLHRLEVADGHDATRYDWPEGWRVTMTMDGDPPTLFYGPFHVYCYVPEGTTTFGGFISSQATVEPIDGSMPATTIADGHFAVDVPPEAAGKVWQIRSRKSARLILMTIPPQIARHPDELLLPREVVER